jgi:trk system potassium uptake protein TrkH
MASSTGIDYIGIANTALPAKILFILIGIAGGCTFSLAGGIKMQRIRQLVNALLRNNDKPTRKELKSILFSIFGFATILLVFSLAFSTLGVSLLDSIFEVSSALTTNGISMGATTIAMPLAYKWLLVIAMIIGRVEIVNIFRVIRGLVR